MNIDVKYFGLVAEKLNKNNESLTLKEVEGQDLKGFFEMRYPELKSVDYQIAVNKTLANQIENDEVNIEVALLPPFAGG